MVEPTSAEAGPRPQRADARRNHARLLEVARDVVAEQGADASLRDIARRAGVGLGTLYRHFPTRDDLLEALLRDGFTRLVVAAELAQAAASPGAALRQWLRECVAGASAYRGMSNTLMATLADETSPLHAACAAMRAAGARLLARAQESGEVRSDVDGTDLFALVGAAAWFADQVPPIAGRQDHLLSVVMDGLAPRPASRPGAEAVRPA